MCRKQAKLSHRSRTSSRNCSSSPCKQDPTCTTPQPHQHTLTPPHLCHVPPGQPELSHPRCCCQAKAAAAVADSATRPHAACLGAAAAGPAAAAAAAAAATAEPTSIATAAGQAARRATTCGGGSSGSTAGGMGQQLDEGFVGGWAAIGTGEGQVTLGVAFLQRVRSGVGGVKVGSKWGQGGVCVG